MPRRNVVYTLIVALISLFIVSRTSFKEQIVRNVARLIAQNSIEAPSETTLMEGAFTGMANAVGDAPYTAYLPPQDQEDYLREMNGQYAGIGLSNFTKDNQSGEFYFVPLANTPASKAGLKFGDRLVAIDGRNVADLSLLELLQSLRGSENSSVEITIRPQILFRAVTDSNVVASPPVEKPPHEEELVTKTVTRELIRQDVVLGDRRDANGNWIYTLQNEPKIGYIAVEQFTSEVGALVNEALSQIEKSGVEKVILDFRNNPGGSLPDAVSICNALLASGSPIVETRDVKGASRKYYARHNIQRRFKLAVLVNGASASASEIVSAALQDAGSAVVVGERTYGKGTVQSIYQIPGRMGILHMTTASFWRPSGRPIHRKHDAKPEDDWGVSPNQGYEVILTPSQRFYTFWTRRVRISEKEANAVNATALSFMTEQTNNLLSRLTDGSPLERTEAALELGIDFEPLAQSHETTEASDPHSSSSEASSNPDKSLETKNASSPSGASGSHSAPFRPLGHAPYFDPQLDRAVDYLNSEN